VLQVESDEIVEAAKKNGVPVEYIVFPDEGHGFVKKENQIRGYSAILTFLDRHLKGQSAPGGDAAKGMPVPVGADTARKTEKR
jgi:dihydropteroate synthase